MGKLIIFEGLDGSGKGTQTELACQNLHSKGYDPLKISFPDYDSPSSALVKMYLSRWGNVYRQNGLIISDRYTTSNAVHQCSKLPPMHWDGFLEWLFEFEYKKLGLPAPDAVVYLAVDPDVSQRLIAQRYHGDESKKDIQERDTEYLARSRAAAEYCARKLGWHRIECTTTVDGQKTIRTPEDIQSEVMAYLERILS